MSIGIKIKKGLDLPIAGTVADTLSITVKPTPSVAINPDDFIGLVPKMEVREGDAVLAGQPLFHDKRHEEIKVVSPAAGKVKAVVRGERRKILRVEVEVAGNEAKQLSVEDVFSSPVKAKSLLLESGLWAMMSQRPYAVVPDPSAEIRDIFVTGFDSSPLAVAQTGRQTGHSRRCAPARDAHFRENIHFMPPRPGLPPDRRRRNCNRGRPSSGR